MNDDMIIVILEQFFDYNHEYIDLCIDINDGQLQLNNTMDDIILMVKYIYNVLSTLNVKISDYDIKHLKTDDYYVLIIYDNNHDIITTLFWDFDLYITTNWKNMIKNDYRFDGCVTLDDVLSRYE